MEDRELVVRMIAYMEKNLLSPISSEDLVSRSGYSLNRLRQKFFNIMGDTPSGYLRKRRLTEAAKEILGGEKIQDAALKYGYSSQDNFTTAFRSYFGVPPGELSRIDSRYKMFISRLREEFSIMEIASLKQPPLCSTLMGCIKGAADYFDLDLSPPMLFGLTGHAFMINTHKELCPGSPYNWDHGEFFRLLSRQGIDHVDAASFNRESSLEERQAWETRMKKHLDEGELCMLTYMEHQLFSGYDEQGFLFLQPWDAQSGYELKQLSYSSWKECLDDQGWVCFDLLEKRAPRGDFRQNLKRALNYAQELFQAPSGYEKPDCAMGYGAYENWIRFSESQGGDHHGSWWNAMVWKECRQQGSLFFREIEERRLLEDEALEISRRLSGIYGELSERLDKIKERKLDDGERIALLKDCMTLEKQAEEGIAALSAGL